MWVKTACGFHVIPKAKYLSCQRTQEKLHRQNHHLFSAAENLKDTRVLTVSGGQTYSQAFLYYGKMAGFEYIIYFIKHLHMLGNTTCLCTFSCECSSDVCFFFTLFLSLYYTNPGSALFFSRESIHTPCKENLTTRYNKWDMERKEEGKERRKL